jgi:phosphatidylglycerophosphatase A
MKARLCLTFASGFYVGFIPGAPGTYASLATTLLFFLLYHVTGRIVPALHLSALCLISVAGILASAEIERSTGREDPSFIVIDEIAGQLLTFLFLPVSPLNLILGFVAFRTFDMWKPFPIRKLESLGGGVGVMADDLLAGVYGNVVLRLTNLLLSVPFCAGTQ